MHIRVQKGERRDCKHFIIEKLNLVAHCIMRIISHNMLKNGSQVFSVGITHDNCVLLLARTPMFFAHSAKPFTMLMTWLCSCDSVETYATKAPIQILQDFPSLDKHQHSTSSNNEIQKFTPFSISVFLPIKKEVELVYSKFNLIIFQSFDMATFCSLVLYPYHVAFQCCNGQWYDQPQLDT